MPSIQRQASRSSENDHETIRLYSEHPDFYIQGKPAEHAFRVPRADTFEIEIGHFIECVIAGKEPLTSGRSQRRPLEIVLDAYQSMDGLVIVKDL